MATSGWNPRPLAHRLLPQVLPLQPTTGKINEKVLFKLPRGSTVPLWVYLKTLQAAAVHNNKSVGEREERQEEGRGQRSRDGEGRRRGGGQEHPGLFLVKKIDCQNKQGARAC